eukprot:scaffold298047_cov51-Prasinocladus_malaysianus.AAC.1
MVAVDEASHVELVLSVGGHSLYETLPERKRSDIKWTDDERAIRRPALPVGVLLRDCSATNSWLRY